MTFYSLAPSLIPVQPWQISARRQLTEVRSTSGTSLIGSKSSALLRIVSVVYVLFLPHNADNLKKQSFTLESCKRNAYIGT